MFRSLWEMKCNLRTAFPSNGSRSVVPWIQRDSRNAEGFPLAPDWFPLSYSNWQVSFLLPKFPLGSYFYNRSASVFLPFLCCFRSLLGSFSGIAWFPHLKRTWLELFYSLCLLPLGLLKRLWPFLHLLGVHWGDSGCQPRWDHGSERFP